MRKAAGLKVAGLGIATALLTAIAAPAAAQANPEALADLRRIVFMPELERLGRIDRIERIDNYLWRVTAGNCTMEVYFVERRRIGSTIPPTWEPRAAAPVCH
jgi:hypothetical protein